MTSKGKRAGTIIGLVAIFVILSVAGALVTARWFENSKRADAEVILNLARQNIEEVLAASHNEARLITAHLGEDPSDTAAFREVARHAVDQDGVSRIYLVEDTTVIDVLSSEPREEEIGKDLSQFPYIVNVARLVCQTVVEGPIELDKGEQVFLFIEPILAEGQYRGEVIVVADAEHILAQLGLSSLSEGGYDYELWRIDSQNGEKRVAAVSDPQMDTSQAVRCVFYLPTEWTLAVIPFDGWVTGPARGMSVAMGILTMLLFASWCRILLDLQARRSRSRFLLEHDAETGMLSRHGLVGELEKRHKRGLEGYTLFLFVMDEYASLARVLDEARRREYLEHVMTQLQSDGELPQLCGRIDDGCFALVALGELSEAAAENMAKELALALLWKTEVNGCRAAVHARWSMLRSPEDGNHPDGLIDEAIQRLDRRYEPQTADEKEETV